VTVTYAGIPLRNVARSLAGHAGVPVVVPDDKAGVKVNVAVRDLRLGAVLDLVAAFVDLEWRFAGGKIVFQPR
jgi:hypothetical protein